MKNKYLTLLFFLFIMGSAFSDQFLLKNSSNPCHIQNLIPSDINLIYSFKEVQAVFDNVEADTLVVFDIDEVLITYLDMVLRPAGIHFRPSSWKDIDPKEIPHLISIMLNEGKIILIEPFAPLLLQKLQKKGIKTIALTAARTGKFGMIQNAEDWRLKNLNHLGFDFSQSFPENRIIHLDNCHKKENDYSLFKDGVLFLGDETRTKGDLLLQFFDKTQWKPKKVIFIDDKMSNLISVQKALKNIVIPFQGYQYKGVEKLPGEFDEQIAEIQFTYLRKYHKWLSDAKAKKVEKYSKFLHR